MFALTEQVEVIKHWVDRPKTLRRQSDGPDDQANRANSEPLPGWLNIPPLLRVLVDGPAPPRLGALLANAASRSQPREEP